MTATERKWEAILVAEGMPAKPRKASGQALSGAVTYRNSDTYSESPILERWTRLTHVVHALPTDYKNRALLITFCELGYVSKTARLHKVSEKTVHRAIMTLNPSLVKGLLYVKR